MSWFTDVTNTGSLSVEKQEGSLFYAPSGVYNATVKFAGIYRSPDSESSGLYIEVELENGVVFNQYINYKNREGKSTITGKDGKEHKGHGLAQLESWDKLIGFGKPNNTPVTYKMWGDDKEAYLFKDAIGKSIKACVRHIIDNQENGKSYNKNEIELLVDKDGKTSGELYYEEDDSRAISLDEWLEKIEKKPSLVRKPKKAKEEPKKETNEEMPW